MEIKNFLLNLRNSIDFELRSKFTWSPKLQPTSPIPDRDFKLQKEFRAFLSLFDWGKHLGDKKSIVAADIGARNFCFGPVMDELFRDCGIKAELHGIEIDAFRRLSNFHTRNDYGVYYSHRIRNGKFHAMDFLRWKTPLDIAFLLNPFVSDEPTLAWGLPLSTLNPQKIFAHTYNVLKANKGFALLSSPSVEEYEIAYELAEEVGFKAGEEEVWHPPKGSVQQKSRFGLVLYT